MPFLIYKMEIVVLRSKIRKYIGVIHSILYIGHSIDVSSLPIPYPSFLYRSIHWHNPNSITLWWQLEILSRREMYKFPLCINFCVLSLRWCNLSISLGRRKQPLDQLHMVWERNHQNHHPTPLYCVYFPIALFIFCVNFSRIIYATLSRKRRFAKEHCNRILAPGTSSTLG